ncbi:hypothetical protein B0H14DRAFT_3473778 [Mycena olivaceomarginata]|nr:hypothetical protein B0H14DRAFT_3473778 [Mycena olivaceomarginata]
MALSSDPSHLPRSPPSETVDFLSKAAGDDERVAVATAAQRRAERPAPRLDSTFLWSLASVLLHGSAFAAHIVLLLVWRWRLEHKAVFPVAKQATVSLAITIVATAINTAYSAALIFVTQSLATRYHLRRHQTLSATHDNLAAWTGMGAAITNLWGQRELRTSLGGVLSTTIYLAAVLALHTTTPALISVAAFNSTSSTSISTSGLPFVASDTLDFTGPLDNALVDAGYLAKGSLGSVTSVVAGSALGLHNNTLYELLDSNNGVGTTTVAATTINVACGYLDHSDLNVTLNTDNKNNTYKTNLPTSIDSTSASYDIPIGSSELQQVSSLLVVGLNDATPTPDRYFFSTIPSTQVFRCSHSLTNGTATVQVPGGELVSLDQDPSPISRNAEWIHFTGTGSEPLLQNWTDSLRDPQGFIGLWGYWYSYSPPSQWIRDDGNIAMADLWAKITFLFLSDGRMDSALMYHLGLVSSKPFDRDNISLSEIEDALSNVIAEMIWTIAHVPPSEAFLGSALDYQFTKDGSNNLTTFTRAQTTVTEQRVLVRFNLSLVAILGGLIACAILGILSLRYNDFHVRRPGRNNSAGGTGRQVRYFGLLQTIWLFRNHPELDRIMEHVDTPDATRLRQAGLVYARLGEGGGGGGEGSFDGEVRKRA